MCNTAVTLHGLNIVIYCDSQITSNLNLFLSLYTYGIFVVLVLGVGGMEYFFESSLLCCNLQACVCRYHNLGLYSLISVYKRDSFIISNKCH